MIFACKTARIVPNNAAGVAALAAANKDPTETLFRNMLTLHHHVHDFDPTWAGSPEYGLDFHDDDNFSHFLRSPTEEPVLLHEDLQRLERELAELPSIIMPNPPLPMLTPPARLAPLPMLTLPPSPPLPMPAHPTSPMPSDFVFPSYTCPLEPHEDEIPFLRRRRTSVIKRKRQLVRNQK